MMLLLEVSCDACGELATGAGFLAAARDIAKRHQHGSRVTVTDLNTNEVWEYVRVYRWRKVRTQRGSQP